MDIISGVISVQTVLIFCAVPLFGYIFLSWILRKSPKNLPPGPREWGTHWRVLKASLNGTLPELADEYARKYGPITLVPTLGPPIVLLNNTDITRKVLASDEHKFLVADRIVIAAFRLAGLNGKDMLFSKYDDIMKKKRRLFHSVIGLYGEGVTRFENVVLSELERMHADIEKTGGKDADIAGILVRSLKIIIYILALGERPEDPSIPDILEEYDLALNRLSMPDLDFILQYLPFIAKIPGRFQTAVDRMRAAKEKADRLIYYDHKASYKPGQPRGIADLLLEYGQKPGYEWINTDEDRVAFLTSIFLAAHLSTRCTVVGIFLCLLNYPETIKRIQEEVDLVIGSKQPRIEHKSSMPYTEATILEGLRLITPLPLSGFRVPSEDLQVDGMTIPKDSMVFMNNRYFLHNENIWEDPWTFKPERFLDSEGQLLPPDHPRQKNLIVFGSGARVCPGEKFSRSRVFLFITSILQRYDLLPPETENLAPADFQTLGGHFQGLVRLTPPFKCRLIRREKSGN
ncbi:hypothetical protein BsWGS_10330 [Bradybaena similaris]